MTETRVMTLTDFLLARIAEDDEDYRRDPEPTTMGDAYVDSLRARLLDECEAKRRILQRYAACVDYDRDQFVVSPAVEGLASITLQFLALPYADHPDYRDEWSA